MVKAPIWTLRHLTKLIVATILNKYDFFLVIEGSTGIGKSTLAYHLAKRVSHEFSRLYNLEDEVVEYYYNRIGKKLKLSEIEFIEKIIELKEKRAYRFISRRDLIFRQDEIQTALSDWHRVIISDEMINVTFNRDFFSEKQKNIIKMINMFRDHQNVIIACVPSFANLDNQVKNLCKMKITIKKRGLGIIHTPNKVIYSKDKWDMATNEKIEKEWIIKKVKNPNYLKLTTVRGIIRFPPLSKSKERLYQQIKNEKRNIILKSEMALEKAQKEDPYEKIYKKLISGEVRNANILDGYAYAMGISPSSLKKKLRENLEKEGKNTSLKEYFWEKKEEKKPKRIKFESI